jgi:hypothetical protein
VNYLKKFFGFYFYEKLLFWEALFFTWLAKMMLLVFPFRICVRMIKKGKYSVEPDLKLLRSVKSAINRADKVTVWKNTCLVQSFAARWMLNRRKVSSDFVIGVKHDETKEVRAHAWLTVKDFEIVPKGDDYITVTKY